MAFRVRLNLFSKSFRKASRLRGAKVFLRGATLAAPLALEKDPSQKILVQNVSPSQMQVKTRSVVGAGLDLTYRDVINIIFIVFENIILVAIGGFVAGHLFFKLLSYKGISVRWYYAVPTDLVLSGVGAYVGFLKGCGSAITYFVKHGLVGLLLNKKGRSKKVQDDSVVDWDETVRTITTKLQQQAANSIFITRPLWTFMARFIEKNLIMIKDPDFKPGNISTVLHAVTTVLARRIRSILYKPFYISLSLYGLTCGAVFALVKGK
eukprot:Phypoly_transcript_15024.p1 GENE.Phypoly_transcript_15024~~Phypoly_transcript_15024.p1  ORF type:complete len:265 (+),score=22.90 Phypoly_transcript_15024:40-834(+)